MSTTPEHRDDTPITQTTGETTTDTTAETVETTGAPEVIRHGERLETSTELEESGRVKVAKHVETHPVEQIVPRSIEHVDTSERQPAVEGDDGEIRTLDYGLVSIPVFEEVLVVTKNLVVRERVIVREQTVVDEYVLHTALRREHVEIDVDDGVDLDDRRIISALQTGEPGRRPAQRHGRAVARNRDMLGRSPVDGMVRRRSLWWLICGSNEGDEVVLVEFDQTRWREPVGSSMRVPRVQ